MTKFKNIKVHEEFKMYLDSKLIYIKEDSKTGIIKSDIHFFGIILDEDSEVVKT